MENGHNAVAQIFVEASPFNWLQPYKAPDQGKVVGTGFFIDTEGHMATSFHVINEAASIKIQIPALGQERFDMNIVGVCPERDLALLKPTEEAMSLIQKQLGKIECLEIGDSDQLKRTQEIIAVGYPLGQDALKTTQGIISGRQNVMGQSFIQMTAALNPGNSGGPTLDKDGKVIGINTAIIPEAQSVGYVTPISDVKNIIHDLHKVKLLRQPMLGCELNYATHDMLKFLNNPEPGGLYVSYVYKDLLFHKAGVQEGDMLYKINGIELDMYGQANVQWCEDKVFLVDLLNRVSIGEKIDLLIYRKGVKKELSFSFDLLEPLPIRIIYPRHETIDYEAVGGMVVMELALNHFGQFLEINPFLINFRRREFQSLPRLLVTSIFSNSQAHKARTVYPGDIIEEVNGQKVTTLEDFRNAVNASKEFLSFKTTSRKLTVLSEEKIVQEEETLMQTHKYKKPKLLEKHGK